MLPFFGIDALVVDDEGRELNKDKRSEGQLAVQQPWPCIFRRIIGGDNKEYTSTMIHDGLYFTGDRMTQFGASYEIISYTVHYWQVQLAIQMAVLSFWAEVTIVLK
jgi:acyl-coenzyme A synthetase/AMP-(fatty) acid ligase